MRRRQIVESPAGELGRYATTAKCERDGGAMGDVQTATGTEWLDSAEVQALLAHRYPFLLVDRIAVLVPGRRVVGYKRVSGGEWWNASGTQASLTMPFGLVIEAMAQ